MKRITLTCPFTGLMFEATQFADGTVIAIHPFTKQEIRMTWNSSCSRYMLPKHAFDVVETMPAIDAAMELGISRQRVSTLCKNGTLQSSTINGQCMITSESVKMYKETRTNGRPRKEVENGRNSND